jgi:hypothetical protein
MNTDFETESFRDFVADEITMYLCGGGDQIKERGRILIIYNKRERERERERENNL